jgi:hypothetical protein
MLASRAFGLYCAARYRLVTAMLAITSLHGNLRIPREARLRDSAMRP